MRASDNSKRDAFFSISSKKGSIQTMKILYPLIAFLILVGCGQAYAKSQRFMPENDLYKYDKKTAVNISEAEFNGILDKIEGIYKPIFSKFGANFILERAWEDSTVNAYADRVGDNWYVKMFGGMARRSEINVIGFGLVACHEIGHHLAGWPFYSGQGQWAANEGQSDYFSTFVCAKKVLGDYPVPSIPSTGSSACDAAYPDKADRDTCYKSISGSLTLANLLAKLGGSKTPSLDTPDPNVVPQTQDEHPAAQCRLDTYFAAAICSKGWNDAAIPAQDGAVCSNRPKCWFKDAGDPGPNPDPNPTPTSQDVEAEAALNGFRASKGIPILYSDEKLVCAASRHAIDVGQSGRCSHIGSDMTNHSKRLKACGFKGFAAELMACKYPTSQDAMNALNRDRLNAYHIYQRYYKKVGCSKAGSYYVCILAI
jgi:uncharacterized protein YkwD